jgi:hypothetical protein
MMGKYFYAILSLTVMPINTAVAEVMLIDDFSDISERRWEFISDQVMGGVSTGILEYKSEKGISYALMKGQVSTANNGGFIQIRTDIDKPKTDDLTGLHIKARGNTQTYYLFLRTAFTLLPWQYYQASFDVTEEWQVYQLPLDIFAPSGRWLPNKVSPKAIRSLGIVAFGRDHNAEIEVAEVGFL